MSTIDSFLELKLSSIDVNYTVISSVDPLLDVALTKGNSSIV